MKFIFSVTVRAPNNKKITIEGISSEDTILDVKKKIEKETGLLINAQRLLINNKAPDNDDKVSLHLKPNDPLASIQLREIAPEVKEKAPTPTLPIFAKSALIGREPTRVQSPSPAAQEPEAAPLPSPAPAPKPEPVLAMPIIQAQQTRQSEKIDWDSLTEEVQDYISFLYDTLPNKAPFESPEAYWKTLTLNEQMSIHVMTDEERTSAIDSILVASANQEPAAEPDAAMSLYPAANQEAEALKQLLLQTGMTEDQYLQSLAIQQECDTTTPEAKHQTAPAQDNNSHFYPRSIGQDLLNATAKKAAEDQFHTTYKNSFMVRLKKLPVMKLFSNSSTQHMRVNGSEKLETIMEYALTKEKDENTTLKICIDLGWLTKEGKLANNSNVSKETKEEVRKAHEVATQNLRYNWGI